MIPEQKYARDTAPITLILRGELPNKKDRLMPRAGKGKGMMYDREVKALMDALVTQARIQWGPRKTLPKFAEMVFRMSLKHARRDRDGIYATVLDALVTARVLENDTVKTCNGRHIIEPAMIDEGEERIEVLIVP